MSCVSSTNDTIVECRVAHQEFWATRGSREFEIKKPMIMILNVNGLALQASFHIVFERMFVSMR